MKKLKSREVKYFPHISGAPTQAVVHQSLSLTINFTPLRNVQIQQVYSENQGWTWRYMTSQWYIPPCLQHVKKYSVATHGVYKGMELDSDHRNV
jgi:hypothetical protein